MSVNVSEVDIRYKTDLSGDEPEHSLKVSTDFGIYLTYRDPELDLSDPRNLLKTFLKYTSEDVYCIIDYAIQEDNGFNFNNEWLEITPELKEFWEDLDYHSLWEVENDSD